MGRAPRPLNELVSRVPAELRVAKVEVLDAGVDLESTHTEILCWPDGAVEGLGSKVRFHGTEWDQDLVVPGCPSGYMRRLFVLADPPLQHRRTLYTTEPGGGGFTHGRSNLPA